MNTKTLYFDPIVSFDFHASSRSEVVKRAGLKIFPILKVSELSRVYQSARFVGSNPTACILFFHIFSVHFIFSRFFFFLGDSFP